VGFRNALQSGVLKEGVGLGNFFLVFATFQGSSGLRRKFFGFVPRPSTLCGPIKGEIPEEFVSRPSLKSSPRPERVVGLG